MKNRSSPKILLFVFWFLTVGIAGFCQQFQHLVNPSGAQGLVAETAARIAADAQKANLNGSSTQSFDASSFTKAGTPLDSIYAPIGSGTNSFMRYTTVPGVATTTFYPGWTFPSNSILVFLGGTLQDDTVDYSENIPNKITFSSPVASGTRVTILRR